MAIGIIAANRTQQPNPQHSNSRRRVLVIVACVKLVCAKRQKKKTARGCSIKQPRAAISHIGSLLLVAVAKPLGQLLNKLGLFRLWTRSLFLHDTRLLKRRAL